MIILPSTPPIPRTLPVSQLNSELTSARSSLIIQNCDSFNESVRYAVNLEHYLENVFEFINSESSANDLDGILRFASKFVLGNVNQVPWTNIKREKKKEDRGDKAEKAEKGDKSNKLDKLDKKLQLLKVSSDFEWTLLEEIQVIVISISSVYIKIGSELINELVDLESTPEVTEKWKQVVNFYKTSISFSKFGSKINSSVIQVFLIKIAEICIQISILSKSLWVNRNSYDPLKTANNGTLSRVAIYVLNEIKTAKQLLKELEITSLTTSPTPASSTSFNYSSWLNTLTIIEKYSTAYSGLFLSIENYQQDKLGHAIGLVNFSLLNLQSKRIEATNEAKGINKLKSKFSTKRNDHLLTSFNSISTLNLDKSVFNEKSGIIVKDVSYLFDQLISLHLKYTKENNNLKFDEIVNWQDVTNDSKWPLGNKIPVSDILAYDPLTFSAKDTLAISKLDEYHGRGAYY